MSQESQQSKVDDQELETAPEPFDAGNKKHVKKREVKARLLSAKNGDVIRAIMATAEGRAWMNNVLGECRFAQDSFDGSSRTFYNEGKRSIGTFLANQIHEHDMPGYLKMIHEQKEAADILGTVD